MDLPLEPADVAKAELDLQTLEDVVNGSATRPNPGQANGTVTARLGRVMRTLAAAVAAIEFIPGRVNIMSVAGANAYTIGSAYYGSKVRLAPLSGALITVTVPNDAPVGATLILRGVGAKVRVLVAAGGSLQNFNGHNGSAAINAPITLCCEVNAAGNNAIWLLDGATSAI